MTVNLIYAGICLVVFLIFLTYRIKTDYLRWSLILLPPLLLLYLIRIPISEFHIVPFWLPGVVVVLGAGLSIFVHVLILVGGQLARKPFNKHFLVRFIRPSLTIVCFIIAAIFAKKALEAADDYGVDIAKKIHQKCNREGQCPQTIEGWEEDSFTLHGRYGAKYPIRYWVSYDDPNSFQIEVRHNIEASLYIYGGVGKTLQKQYHHNQNEKVDIE